MAIQELKAPTVAASPTPFKSSIKDSAEPQRGASRVLIVLAFAAVYIIWGSTYDHLGVIEKRHSHASSPHQAMETKVTKSTNGHSEGPTVSQREHTCCPVLELRQYALHPGKRDVLIELFDREFVESQEVLGMDLVGQFRDLDDPNRFIWFRGFRDMPSRARALEAFYGGPVWKAHREAANATMIDSSNVLLLRPARPGSEFSIRNDRPRVGAKESAKSLIVATIYYFNAPVTEDFIDFFEGTVKPRLTDAGASLLACFVTEHSTNTFPRLPVREGENVFVWISSFRDQAAYKDHETALARSERWKSEVSKELARRIERREVLKLSPTQRSRLRG